MTDAEFEAIRQDSTKQIIENISWEEDEDHSPSVEFRHEIISSAGYPLFVRGSYNGLAQTLTYAIIHRTAGRIYGLDIGKDHHNPTCQNVGDRHLHIWDDVYKDKSAIAATMINASIDNPIAIWSEFCDLFQITHTGRMQNPPPIQPILII